MKFIYLIIFVLFFNCNKHDVIDIHGISNLKLKIQNIKINYSNQNDIRNLVGPPLIIDSFDKNTWSYYEVRKKTNIFGNKKLVLNDIVFLKFNNQGLLIDYKTFDINSLKKINFSEDITEVYAISHGFINTFLTSARKRMDMSKNRFKTNEQ